MTPIKTNGITILLVEVPEDAKSWDKDVFTIGEDSYVRIWSKSGHDSLIDLPSGKWELMGESTELTDSQMKDIAADYPYGIEVFPDYNLKSTISGMVNYFHTIQESYLSLLEANGICDSNKIHLVLKRI